MLIGLIEVGKPILPTMEEVPFCGLDPGLKEEERASCAPASRHVFLVLSS